MCAIATKITGVSIVCSAVCSGADQRNIKAPRHWSLRGVSTGPRKGPVTAVLPRSLSNSKMTWAFQQHMISLSRDFARCFNYRIFKRFPGHHHIHFILGSLNYVMDLLIYLWLQRSVVALLFITVYFISSLFIFMQFIGRFRYVKGVIHIMHWVTGDIILPRTDMTLQEKYFALQTDERPMETHYLDLCWCIFNWTLGNNLMKF